MDGNFRRLVAAIATLLISASGAVAQQLTVGTFLQNNLYEYAGPTGPAPGTVVASASNGVFGIAGLAQRPGDPSVYFSAQQSETIFRYTPGVGVSPVVLSSTLHSIANPGNPGGTNSYGPGGLAFGSDGLLYVTRSGGFGAPMPGTAAVDRFDITTGMFVDSLITGLSGTVGLTVSGSDLYVSNRLSPTFAQGNVLKVANYATAPVITDLIPSGTGTLAFPVNSAMGPDNMLYVADVGDELGSFGTPFPGAIRRYDPISGVQDLSFSMPMPGLSPSGLFFTSDGNLLVANLGTSFGPSFPPGLPFNGNVQLWNVGGASPSLINTIESGLMASVVIVAIPEPGLLLLLGLGGVLAVRRRAR